MWNNSTSLFSVYSPYLLIYSNIVQRINQLSEEYKTRVLERRQKNMFIAYTDDNKRCALANLDKFSEIKIRISGNTYTVVGISDYGNSDLCLFKSTNPDRCNTIIHEISVALRNGAGDYTIPKN